MIPVVGLWYIWIEFYCVKNFLLGLLPDKFSTTTQYSTQLIYCNEDEAIQRANEQDTDYKLGDNIYGHGKILRISKKYSSIKENFYSIKDLMGKLPAGDFIRYCKDKGVELSLGVHRG